jgi:drug/metabolite transporter (DMT)-like permease
MTENDSAIQLRSIAAGGTVQAAAGVLCFSFSFPATVWALSGFGPWALTGLRGVFAAALAAACLVACRVPVPARSDWPGLLVVAGGCVVGFPLLTAIALQTSSAAHSAVVIGLLPLATAVAAALRSGAAKPPRAFWWAALAGAAVVVAFVIEQSTIQQGSGRPSVADLYLFAALLICAAGYAEGGRLARRMAGWQVIAWSLVAALPVMLLIASLGLATEPVRLTTHGAVGLLYLAAVSQFGGFVVWYRGMAAIGVPRASQLQLAQPLLTLVWSALVLGEHLPLAAPVAALAVVGCIAATQRVRRDDGQQGDVGPGARRLVLCGLAVVVVAVVVAVVVVAVLGGAAVVQGDPDGEVQVHALAGRLLDGAGGDVGVVQVAGRPG